MCTLSNLSFYLLCIEGALVVTSACSVHLYTDTTTSQFWRFSKGDESQETLIWYHLRRGHQNATFWRVVRVAVMTTTQGWRVSEGDESEKEWIWYHLVRRKRPRRVSQEDESLEAPMWCHLQRKPF